MDFSLSNEQRAWQMTARKFAEEEIKPISLKLDEAPDAHGTFDWDIVEKGWKLGLRTMAVPKEYGGEGTDYVTQALVMAELARGDSAISKTFSQNWKWSHLISAACNQEQKDRFLRPFVADHRFLLGKGITEPSAGSDNRLPPKDAPKAGLKLRAERQGDEWILNGEKCFIANAPVGKLFFIDARTDPNAPLRQGTTMFLVPSDTPGFRIGKVFNKSGWRFYRNGEMIFENARVPHANVVGQVGTSDMKTAHGRRPHRRRPVRRPGARSQRTRRLRRRLRAGDEARPHRQTGRAAADRSAAHRTQAQQDEHADRGAALLRDADRLGARSQDAFRQRGLAMNFSTDVIQEVTELNLEIHGGAGRAWRSPCREAGARQLHLEPPRRRQRAAAQGGGAAGADGGARALTQGLHGHQGPRRKASSSARRCSAIKSSSSA